MCCLGNPGQHFFDRNGGILMIRKIDRIVGVVTGLVGIAITVVGAVLARKDND